MREQDRKTLNFFTVTKYLTIIVKQHVENGL